MLGIPHDTDQMEYIKKDCVDLFRKYNIFDFIADCYDSLHLNSYACALADVEMLLKNRGVTV